MVQFSEIVIIYNPKSTGASVQKAKLLARRLKRVFDGPITLLATKHPGHGEELAEEYASKSQRPLILSSSGDGGYNEIINGTMNARAKGAKPVCLVIPSGNANDHFRTLYGTSPYKLITNGSVSSIDLLKVQIKYPDNKTLFRYAHSYAGLGVTSEIAAELNKHKLNAAKELWVGTKAFLNFNHVRIEHNNKRFNVDSIICTNIGQMAKRLTVSTKSKPDDGAFEVLITPHKTKKDLVKDIFQATVNSLEAQHTYKRYEFTVLSKTSIQLDGEVIPLKPSSHIIVSIERHALETLTA